MTLDGHQHVADETDPEMFAGVVLGFLRDQLAVSHGDWRTPKVALAFSCSTRMSPCPT